MNRNFVRGGSLLIALSFAIFAGCNAPKSNLTKFNRYFNDYNLEESGEFAKSKISNSEKPKGEDLLWSLQAGTVLRLEQSYKESNKYFDGSEEMLNYFDYQNKAIDSVASIAINENIAPYVGEEYDGIMLNTYKALNFMALGDNDAARVEFNRALDRQRIAKEKFAKEIAKIQEDIDKEQKKKDSRAKQNVENPEVDKILSEKYPNLYAFQAYPDFVNPFTNYIAGVFFNLVEDHQKASTFIKESYGMVGDNQYIAEDMAVTEKILDGQGQLRDVVWVIFENGMGPIKEEFRVDLPLFIATDKVKYVGFALPRLEFRSQAYPYLTVRAADKSYQTKIVADMDRIIQTEFKKDFKAILARAIISTTAKAVAQYALDHQGDSNAKLASVLVAVYSFATTAADVRIWTTLPKNFQVARLPIPADRKISIEPPGGTPLNIEIPACKNALVYIRIPLTRSMPVYDVMTY
ncbi:MAG: hypothetical protein ABIF19_13515 [Planctomycetota bacterium]